MDKEKQLVLVSKKQLEAIKTFFNDTTEDMLYWGAARWGKSEVIGIILAICISAFPWSAWLLSRTSLSDLKATTLATFFKVIKRFWYWDKTYKDKVRDERHIVFNNESKLFVIQVNLEPWDPEFDRIWSYWYTWWFLDEWQQMSNKVREVLQGRLSELNWSFTIEVPYSYKKYKEDELNPWYTVDFGIVWETQRNREDIKTPKSKIKEIRVDNWLYTVVVWYEKLFIPYKILKVEEKNWKLYHTYSWHFKGVIFTWCNPWQNFTKTEFYNPWRDWKLPDYMSFLPAKVDDNPWVDEKYIDRLRRLPEESIRKQRLLYGNFDYDDSPWLLFDTNTIQKMFDRYVEHWADDTPYITVDAARQGKDTTEIGVWRWLELFEIHKISKMDLVWQAEFIEELMWKYWVDNNNVIIDEVWVWWGLVDMLRVRWFIGNSQPLQPYASKFLSYKKRNYANLRTQAFYYLQKYMSHISIKNIDIDTKELITNELLTVKEKNVDWDSKMQIVPKSQMKEELWRSPDLADMLSMRMWWLIDRDFRTPQKKEEVVEEKKDELYDYIMWFDRKKQNNLDLDVY